MSYKTYKSYKSLMLAVLGFIAIPCGPMLAASSRAAYTNFTIIPERNIFNTKRSPAYRPSNKPVRTVRNDFIALTGTMRDEKGALAFFDGSQADYRKVVKPNDTIGGFQIEDIEHAYVKLKHGTNEMILPVNKQLAREEQGEWQLADRSESRSADLVQSSASSTQTNRESDANGRRGDRGDRRDQNREGRNVSNADSTSPPLAAGGPVPKDASTGTNANASAVSTAGAQTEADVLRIMEERRRREDQ